MYPSRRGTLRFLRIFPALLVNLLFCVFVIGPLFTTLPITDYYLNSQTSAFLTKNLFMFFGEEGELPGVFKTSHFEPYVNGSLWTLPYEVKMYVSIAVLSLCFAYLKRDNFVKFFTVASAGILGALLAIILFKFLKHHDPIRIHPHFRLGSMFFIGVCFYTFRSRIRLATVPFLGCLAVLIVFAFTTNLLFIPYMLTIGYIIFYLAYIPGGFLRKFNDLPNYSYGLYIYSFPIQQALSVMYPSLH